MVQYLAAIFLHPSREPTMNRLAFLLSLAASTACADAPSVVGADSSALVDPVADSVDGVYGVDDAAGETEDDSADTAEAPAPAPAPAPVAEPDIEPAPVEDTDTAVVLREPISGALVLHSAQISDTTPGGNSWDWGLWGHAPDPYAEIVVGGQIVFATAVHDDTTSLSFDEATPVTIFPGQQLRIFVWDKDSTSGDELIGVFTYDYDQVDLLSEAGVFVDARPSVSLGVEFAR